MSQHIAQEEQTDPAREIANAILDKPAVLFAGQGSQAVGMGRDVAEADAEAMDLWREAEKISGLPLREIYWDGKEMDINDTRALQPALTVVNFNLWRAFAKKTNIQPLAVAGHSLGEFCALAAAEAISPKSAIELTALRGRLMAEADPEKKGAMAAIVKLDEATVFDIIKDAASESGEILVGANYNTPEQLVVSGGRGAVDLACKKAKNLKGRGVPLKVSGAFHSPLMEEANREFAPLVEKIDWKDPRYPVYSNAEAKAITDRENVKKSILKQMISPVYWVNLIRALYLAGARWWLEISPRAVLGKMVGPSIAGIAGQLDSLRIETISSLQNILSYAA